MNSIRTDFLHLHCWRPPGDRFWIERLSKSVDSLIRWRTVCGQLKRSPELANSNERFQFEYELDRQLRTFET